MDHDSADTDETPALQTVLDALADPDCRTILDCLTTPMTANDLSETCDIPMSTMYRKLDLLSDAALIRGHTELRQVGRHTTRYERNFEAVEIVIESDRGFELAIDRPARGADERLADLWSAMREES